MADGDLHGVEEGTAFFEIDVHIIRQRSVVLDAEHLVILKRIQKQITWQNFGDTTVCDEDPDVVRNNREVDALVVAVEAEGPQAVL